MLKLLLISGLAVSVWAAQSKNDEKYYTALRKEFQDFVHELPTHTVYLTIIDHVTNDEQMRSAIMYILDKDFQHEVRALKGKPSVKEFLMRYKDAGLDAQEYESIAMKLLAMMTFEDDDINGPKSFGKLLADLSDQLPYDRWLDMLADKLENSPVFIRFWNAITDKEVHLLANKAMQTREFKHFAQDLEDMDVPIYRAIEIMFSLYGWANAKASPNDL